MLISGERLSVLHPTPPETIRVLKVERDLKLRLVKIKIKPAKMCRAYQSGYCIDFAVFLQAKFAKFSKWIKFGFQPNKK